jgi:hypothetical protein
MSKPPKKYNEVVANEVPEVLHFQGVKAKYEAFRAANPDFFTYLDTLTEEYNTAWEAAEKAVRAKGVSCGDFVLYQYATKYKPYELFSAMGHDKFLAVGGVVSTRTIYDVDKTRVDSAIASGDIPPAVASQIRTQEARYKKPSKLELP